MDKNIVISIKTMLWGLLALLGLYVVYRLGSIIGIVAISLLISISLEHTVRFFMRQTLLNRTLSRSFSVIVTYVVSLILLILVVSVGLDPVLTQGQKMLASLKQYESAFSIGGDSDVSISTLLSELTATSGGLISATKSVFNNITTLFSVLILSVYISLDWENIKRKAIAILPKDLQKKVTGVVAEIENSVGIWLKGQLFLMLVIGVLSYIALLIVGVEFPLALALIAGLLEIVPIIGPVVSGIIAAFVAVMDDPVKAVLVIVMFTVIQQLEGNILVPKVMERVSGFSPIIILIALLVGSELFGIMGAVIAVPVMMILFIIAKEFLNSSA